MIAMAEKAAKASPTDSGEPDPPMPFKRFLEAFPLGRHPGLGTLERLYIRKRKQHWMRTPDIRLHCSQCDGERTFRLKDRRQVWTMTGGNYGLWRILRRLSSQCKKQYKLFALRSRSTPSPVMAESRINAESGPHWAFRFRTRSYDYLAVTVRHSSRAASAKPRPRYWSLCLLQACVENHKNDILDAIIGVCETVKAQQEPDRGTQESQDGNLFHQSDGSDQDGATPRTSDQWPRSSSPRCTVR